MSFIQLHLHSEYSWLDGACCIEELLPLALGYEMPALAITDRNSLAGAYPFWKACLKAGIKPIIGMEIEVLNDISDGHAYSIILLAKNTTGYYNLCRLLSLAFENDASAPKVSKTQLKAHAKDLICLSFSVSGELCSMLLAAQEEKARQVSDWYHSVFGEDYYYEIQAHGLPAEERAMNMLLKLAYSTKIPVVLTNDCHYLKREDSTAIDALNCLRKGMDFRSAEAKRFASNEYYFKNMAKMQELIQYPEAIFSNSLAIAAKTAVLSDELFCENYLTLPDALAELLQQYGTKESYTKQGYRIPPEQFRSLKAQLEQDWQDYKLVPCCEYERWMPQSIYAAVMNVMGAENKAILELCSHMNPFSESLPDAFEDSVEFSVLCADNPLHYRAFELACVLQNTFANILMQPRVWALFPKSLPLPLVRDKQGREICQYDFEVLRDAGIAIFEETVLYYEQRL